MISPLKRPQIFKKLLQYSRIFFLTKNIDEEKKVHYELKPLLDRYNKGSDQLSKTTMLYLG